MSRLGASGEAQEGLAAVEASPYVPTGLHLVGSVPLASAEEVFRTVGAGVGDRLRRLPDGETGPRADWIVWQYPVLSSCPQFEVAPPAGAFYRALPRLRVRDGEDASSLAFGSLGYADAARSSYRVFSLLKRAGDIPRACRFQVCLPTPLAPISAFVARDDQAAVEPLYEAAMRSELGQILDAVPHDQLAIQWDTNFEFALLEGDLPAWFPDIKASILERMIRVSRLVPGDVELGFHFCYGDGKDVWRREPADAGRLVEIANALSSSLSRALNWIHMPVLRGSDQRFLEPLAELRLHPETELYIGLLGLDEPESLTRARIERVHELVGDFGVASACGWGRHAPARVPDLLTAHADHSRPVSDPGRADRDRFRVFRDKPHGLIVDYIGIGDDLREAAARYAKGGGTGDPAPSVEDAARPLFMQALGGVRAALPSDIDYGDWRSLSRIELEDRFALVYGYLTDEERRNAFLQSEAQLRRAFLLVKHLDDCRAFADEVLFVQQVRKQVLKTVPGDAPKTDIDQAVKDLVDNSIESGGVADIFKIAGIDRPDVSILDDEFLQTFKDKPNENLRVQLLEKLLADEIRVHERRNLTQARSFRELLENTLRQYHNRLIDAAAVIQEMIEIRKQLAKHHRRAEELGVSEEELAFYDALSVDGQAAYDDAFLRELVHEVVHTVKRNLKVDWTAPHRDSVRAAVRAAVKRTLRQRGVRAEDFDRFVDVVMEQAVASFAAWPLAA